MAIEKYLKDLETEEFEARQVLGSVKTRMNEYLSQFPRISVYPLNIRGSYQDCVINAPVEKVEGVARIRSGSKGSFVVLKSGERKRLEDYFTEDEIDSIRLI
ncbi:hypothetical protein KAU33_03930 [Candidatus Dependentiae bacterium]|nr:hypothetical protein [Candidatus Dependentiae bacterium]